MPQLTRKRSILAKIETTYGTDSVPTGTANAILVKNMNIAPLSATVVGRDLIRPYFGEFDQLTANAHVEVDFEVEIAGSGALGTAPAYGPLLRACAMAETVTASTKVEYAPISSALESITIYYNVDGVLHKVTGARGTVELNLVVNQIPTFKFKFTGIFNAVVDAALPTNVYTGWIAPLVASNVNTTGFTFFGVSSFVLQSLMMNINNSVDYRSLIGSEYVQITDRRVSGEVNFESTSVAAFDLFGTARGTSTGAISIVHGTATGNKVTIASTKIDIGNPTYADDNGVNMAKVPFFALPTSGNDEFKITIT